MEEAEGLGVLCSHLAGVLGGGLAPGGAPGFIQVCAWCERIRDEAHGWTPAVQYLEELQGTPLSHGICDDCAETQYKDSPGGRDAAGS